ncbi:MAG: M28 family peptidase [Armatimonadota bacterium]|nr:M28 family peptidase [Armatimonadota bacterium]
MSRRATFSALLLSLAAVSALVGLPALGIPYQGPPAWTGAPVFDQARAFAFAETLAVRFPRRWSGSPDRQAAADWLSQTLADLGLKVQRHRFSAALGVAAPVTMENVWAVSRGGERPDEIIVPLGNYDMAPTSFQAASDTAGHVGTLLELARVIHAAPHRRTFVFVFPDGEEWGMLGARHFARTFGDRAKIVAAFSIEDLDVGEMRALGIDGVGQFRGFAPMWMRALAADAARLEGLPVEEVPPLLEWLQRSLLVSSTDQGPLLGQGIPAVDLAGRSAETALKDRIYHLPGDTIEHMRPEAFRTYGRTQERVLRAVDAMPEVPRESGTYLRLGPDRIVPGGPLVAVQVGVFLPLLVAVVSRSRAHLLLAAPPAAPAASWAAFRAESRALGALCGVLAAGLLAVKALPRLGLIPAYELYPPPPRHPELTSVPWPAVVVGALILLAVVWQVRRCARAREVAPAARGAVALLWLLAVSVIALSDNPFGAVTFLLLPALLWIWPQPSLSRGRRVGNGLLVLLGFGTIVLLVVQYAQTLRIGSYILWYLMMSLAYGQFTLLRILLALATIAIGLRLLVLTVSRRLP